MRLKESHLHLLPAFSVVYFILLLDYSQGTISSPACPEPKFKENQLIRTSPNSKFLYPKNPYYTSSANATSLCESLSLESAKVTGKWEYKHLIDFIYEMNRNNTRPDIKVNLGAVKNGFGPFEYLDRQPPYNQLQYQTFKLESGEYLTDGANCLAIELSQSNHYFVPIHCEQTEVMPLCQYKPEEPCSVNSSSTMQDEDKQLNNLFKVGESEKYVYYGAMKQRTWNDAFQNCKAHRLKLVSFHKRHPELIMEILKFINEYKNTLGTQMWFGFSWTSGRFIDDKKFNFDLTSEPWNINEMLDYLKWNDQLTVDRKRESCILVTANGLRPVICELPNYFLCFARKKLATEFPSTILAVASAPERKLVKRESNQKCKIINSVNFTPGGIPVNDTIGLIQTSISLNFSDGLSDSLTLNEKSRWRIPHIREMGELTKLVCPQEHVRPTFINKLLNFIMIYYNSIEEQVIPPKRINFWKDLTEKYSSCNNVTGLTLSATGGLITAFEGSERTGKIIIIKEKADTLPVLDLILEGLWFMFEITAGACYKSNHPGILWLSQYFHYFRKDFTDQFKSWWMNPGKTNYGLIFGDIDLHENFHNLRACSAAHFQRLDIEDLFLVRPIEVGDYVFLSKSLNQRI